MKILVSVRDAEEARIAARAGVDLIDLKEPSRGALGGLPPEAIASITALLRRIAPATPVSATIGDWPADALEAITRQVRAVAACGVDYVKVGVLPGPCSRALIARLGELQAGGLALVPVFIADHGLPDALVGQALAHRFPALMLDTQDKRAGSLMDVTGADERAGFVARVQAGGALAGLSGALRLHHLARLGEAGPDFAGFRSVVCRQDRAATLEASRLADLIAAVAATRRPGRRLERAQMPMPQSPGPVPGVGGHATLDAVC
ncbi:uncharacterized protein (UPF0264 family) [Sphaerotilus hippei]|uniref:(5-formylfuran-3-yl)methyl phosphate synthase n=1 Tax=Sphaerotilus hippei TaxID=744406 RepID=A0A318GWN7_9BURK|nr:(5-formylfuran-3-yl)methyl phosphate synthase [Sphaerotilus hippei]PXW91572.1 uncharacterized protein (UPF0264 family) [Sphaerotilus hippei]